MLNITSTNSTDLNTHQLQGNFFFFVCLFLFVLFLFCVSSFIHSFMFVLVFSVFLEFWKEERMKFSMLVWMLKKRSSQNPQFFNTKFILFYFILFFVFMCVNKKYKQKFPILNFIFLFLFNLAILTLKKRKKSHVPKR